MNKKIDIKELDIYSNTFVVRDCKSYANLEKVSKIKR